MKDRLLYNWSIQRLFYVLMGLGIIAESIAQKEWMGALLGGYFLSMGVFAFGCAAPGGCYTGTYRSNTNQRQAITDTEYEEVK